MLAETIPLLPAGDAISKARKSSYFSEKFVDISWCVNLLGLFLLWKAHPESLLSHDIKLRNRALFYTLPDRFFHTTYTIGLLGPPLFDSYDAAVFFNIVSICMASYGIFNYRKAVSKAEQEEKNSNLRYALLGKKPLDEIEALLKAGANLKWDFAGAPLHLAWYVERKKDLFTLLLKYGLEINAPTDEQGRTELMWRAIYNDLEGMKLLLDYNADIEVQDQAGYTALLHVKSDRNNAAFKLLLSYGANINSQDNHGVTLLMKAARTGENSQVQFLLEHGADSEIIDEDGCTVDWYAEDRESLFSQKFDNCEVRKVLADYRSKEIHRAATKGLTEQEHKRNMEKMSSQDIAEIAQLQKLVPGPGKGTGGINNLIADYIYNPVPIDEDVQAVLQAQRAQEQEEEDKENVEVAVAESRW